jgi:hypothetical protein
MKLLLGRLLAPLACALLLGGWSMASEATLVTSRFNGTVTGYNWGFVDPAFSALDDDHPLGAPVEWDLTFDNAFLALGYPGLFAQPMPAVSGSLQVGSDEYTFTDWHFFSLMLESDFTTILSYRPQISAVGPDTSDGAHFFGMFWSFAPDLSLIGSPLIGFGYTNGNVTSYAYLVTSGDYSVAPTNQVPEPATALLALPALWLLRRRHARG